ncbi:hypothetical protein VTN00DRAFT_9885 [Thermoascus crustaceus]|uniref:uncharacterized protein n=1 Tax=Thermoascus crustaceus TaxID=5088 RepID=UPI0037420DCA
MSTTIPSSSTTEETRNIQPPPPTGYTLHSGYPPVPAYLHLRSASGLSPQTPAQATAALQGSWYGCYITHGSNDDDNTTGGTPVAMGRIIGDGGWYFHIVDMAVLPQHQRRGLGDAISEDAAGEDTARGAAWW